MTLPDKDYVKRVLYHIGKNVFLKMGNMISKVAKKWQGSEWAIFISTAGFRVSVAERLSGGKNILNKEEILRAACAFLRSSFPRSHGQARQITK